MIVEHIMTKSLFTLTSESTLQEANTLMREKKIRHLPIVDENHHLVGLIAQRDIKNTVTKLLDEADREKILKTRIADIMIRNPLVGHPLDFIEEIALVFYEYKIGCLPIVTQNKLVGIVTDTDLLYNYIELTGATKPSSRIDIRIEDAPGILNKITQIIAESNTNILSLLIYPEENLTTQVISIRLSSMNPQPIIRSLHTEGFDVLWPNMLGSMM